MNDKYLLREIDTAASTIKLTEIPERVNLQDLEAIVGKGPKTRIVCKQRVHIKNNNESLCVSYILEIPWDVGKDDLTNILLDAGALYKAYLKGEGTPAQRDIFDMATSNGYKGATAVLEYLSMKLGWRWERERYWESVINLNL